MIYKNIISLLETTKTSDAIGNEVITITKQTDVLFNEHSLGAKEYYNAVSVGMRPVAEVQIRSAEYNGEEKAQLNGQIYDVLRAIKKGRFDVVLVLGFKLENNGEETVIG